MKTWYRAVGITAAAVLVSASLALAAESTAPSASAATDNTQVAQAKPAAAPATTTTPAKPSYGCCEATRTFSAAHGPSIDRTTFPGWPRYVGQPGTAGTFTGPIGGLIAW